MGRISTNLNPASWAYRLKVSGRMTVPVAAEGCSVIPTGWQWSTLKPYIETKHRRRTWPRREFRVHGEASYRRGRVGLDNTLFFQGRELSLGHTKSSPPGLRNDYDSVLTKLRYRFGHETFAQEWSEGKDAALDSVLNGFN